MNPDDASQAPIIAFLSDPMTHGGAAVQRMSTHGAHIFLAGDTAYKLKRAVKLAFFDFSTVDRRQRMLETELALNRPAAPGIYLDVCPIRISPPGRLHFGGDGPIADWVLKMRRFPQEALLDNLALAEQLAEPAADALAEMVADMHVRARMVRDPVAASFRAAALDNVEALRIDGLPADLVMRLGDGLARSLTALRAHLDARAEAGFVRHGHGDLHLGNIVMIEGRPTPFDALEFDPALAIGDTFYDLAFLLMDLDHRGLRRLANRVLSRYVQITGDIEGLRALPLFLAVRAAVRAKVAAIGSGQATDAAHKAEALATARSYAQLALDYLQPSAVHVIGVGGLSGTGKSLLAQGLAPTLAPGPGAIVLRSDVTRKTLFRVPETARLPKDSYTIAASQAVYQRLLADAGRALTGEWSVIVDAVFSKEEERKALEDIARAHDARFIGLWLEAPLAVRLQRVGARVNDASDADAAVVRAQDSRQAPSPAWERCDAGGSAAATLENALRIISTWPDRSKT